MKLLPPFAKLDEVIEAEPEIASDANATSLDIVRRAYRGDTQITSKQLRAAIAALPFEYPKLAVTASLGGRDFAAEIEAAIGRSGKMITLGPAQPAKLAAD